MKVEIVYHPFGHNIPDTPSTLGVKIAHDGKQYGAWDVIPDNITIANAAHVLNRLLDEALRLDDSHQLIDGTTAAESGR